MITLSCLVHVKLLYRISYRCQETSRHVATRCGLRAVI